jgi:ribonuclease P protein component
LKRFTLPKICLVRKGWEFDQVYGQGRRLHGEGFSLIYRDNGLSWNRLGISINGKIKGAVKRNRIKRVVRESFRLNREWYPADADIIFTVRPGFSLVSPSAVSQAVSSLFFGNNEITCSLR